VGSKTVRNPLARSLAVVSCMANACERVRRYLFFLSACELRAAGQARIVWRLVAAGVAREFLRRAGLIMRRVGREHV
jgi:hypothetical protein